MNRNELKIEKPIFMIGVPRSGTTLVADLISFHEDLGWFSNHLAKNPEFPKISMLNRLTDIPKIGHFFRGKEIRRNKNKLKNKLPYPREAYSVWDLYCTPNFSIDYLLGQTPTPKANESISNVILQTLKYHRKKRFLNKMTGPARISYLSKIFPDARFVHIIRDPRAVVSSLLKVRFWVLNGGLESPWWENGLDEKYLAEWEKSGKNPAVLAAVQWRQIIEHARTEMRHMPKADKTYMEIRYEQFIENPTSLINEILDFADLDRSCRVIDNLRKRTKIKNMNYKYNEYLSREDIKAIEHLTRPVSEELGYC